MPTVKRLLLDFKVVELIEVAKQAVRALIYQVLLMHFVIIKLLAIMDCCSTRNY